jgi:hypothetical protein
VVVAVGLTLVEPVAEVDVKFPGVMVILVAPLVAQLSVQLDPAVRLVGLAVNALIVGMAGGLTVTVKVEVVAPAALVAVRVYVVVAVGLNVVEPVADADVNVPGVMVILVAPLVDQFSVVLAPELMFVAAAIKELIVGAEPA